MWLEWVEIVFLWILLRCEKEKWLSGSFTLFPDYLGEKSEEYKQHQR